LPSSDVLGQTNRPARHVGAIFYPIGGVDRTNVAAAAGGGLNAGGSGKLYAGGGLNAGAGGGGLNAGGGVDSDP
jgi:hypothetical protein